MRAIIHDDRGDNIIDSSSADDDGDHHVAIIVQGAHLVVQGAHLL